MLRKTIKGALLSIIKWLDKKPRRVVRQEGPFWNREVLISPSIIFTASIILIFVSIVLEIGPVPRKLFGFLMFSTVSFGMAILYFTKYSKRLLKENDAMMLIGILAGMSVLLIEVLKPIDYISPFMVPLPGMILLSALLLSEQIGIILAIAISFVCGILYNFKLEYSFYQFLGCIVGISLSSTIKHRQDIMSVGVKISIINILSVLTFTLLDRIPYNQLINNMLFAAGNGLLSAVLVLGLLSPLETFFSRITNIKLLELSDFSQPLLKRLMIEAPGTYHHSLLVASIAEQAAKAIGANSLLVRVGALYHDIGKLIKPEYFIENQVASENPHDSILPSMSGLVVTSHVKEGVNLARLSNLDTPIIDLIEQHHGNSLIHTFYQKAIEKSGQAEEDNYRYPGPKATSKESAILTLADSCEAATRVIENPSPIKIKDLVEKVVNNKFTDGQFDDAPLSLNDLHKIAESITTTLVGIYHVRIEYEKEKNKEQG